MRRKKNYKCNEINNNILIKRSDLEFLNLKRNFLQQDIYVYMYNKHIEMRKKKYKFVCIYIYIS